MLSGNELFVILKLVSGEQVMAVLRSEDESFIEIESPMCIRTIPVLETNKEHITAHPLCQFSDDVNYVLDKKDVMFVKKMHHIFIPHYLRIVKEHEELSIVNEEKSPRAEDLVWGDETDTTEEFKRKVELLRSLLGKKEEEDDFKVYVEGNDTIN
jgi:hypothetical protein